LREEVEEYMFDVVYIGTFPEVEAHMPICRASPGSEHMALFFFSKKTRSFGSKENQTQT
jgi:hypothetical protein